MLIRTHRGLVVEVALTILTPAFIPFFILFWSKHSFSSPRPYGTLLTVVRAPYSHHKHVCLILSHRDTSHDLPVWVRYAVLQYTACSRGSGLRNSKSECAIPPSSYLRVLRRRTVGMNFGILLAWVVFAVSALPFAQWFVIRKELREAMASQTTLDIEEGMNGE
jgi:hypothetical protein